MERKMLFLDLDGTLLNDEKKITEGNRQALDRALRNGHSVIITTGRPLKSAMVQARNLGLDKPGCFLIAYNGALVYDWEKQAQVFARTLDMDAVLEIFEMANSRGFHLQTYDTWDVLVEPRCDDDIIRRYCAFTGMEYRVIGDIRTDLKEAPMKILIIEEEDFAGSKKLQDDIMAALSHKVNTAFSCPTYLEAVPAGLNKGEAVKMLCRMMEVPIENAVAAGDAANDLSMIEMAGVGVAMANGTDEVKAAADYITKNDNNHDGIAEIIERFFD